MTSATSKSAGSGNSICRDQPDMSVTSVAEHRWCKHTLCYVGDVAGFDRVDLATYLASIFQFTGTL